MVFVKLHKYKISGFIFFLFFLTLLSLNCGEAYTEKSNTSDVCFWEKLKSESRYWVDSVYNSLTLEERIAQLFWIAVENPTNATAFRRAISETETYQPGGILLFRMSPETALEVIDEFQKVSNTPLFVSIDGEWGLAMRFPGVEPYPFAMTLGAIHNDSLIYRMGRKMAHQFRLCGIHVNMAPVADVNSNPANPVIGFRSFGEDPKNVARKSIAYMQGLQDGGVMAVGKHFPGHGDTSTDSHKTLPLVAHSRQRLDSMEIYPFKRMIDEGLWAVMSAHIEIPELESEPGLPVSFSQKVLKDLLRDEMGFRGLVITDALNMEGARVMGKPGERDVLALSAGNDIVEFTEDLPAAIKAVKEAIKNETLSFEAIEDKCRRSLAFKYWLIERKSLDVDAIDDDSDSLMEMTSTENILELLNNEQVTELNRELYEAALTLLRNENDVISWFENQQYEGAFVLLGEAPALLNKISNRFDCPVYQLPLNNPSLFSQRVRQLEKYQQKVIVISDTRWGSRAGNAIQLSEIGVLADENSVVFFLGNPYHLINYEVLTNAAGLIVAYQNNEQAQLAVINALSGHINFSGRLPVSVGELFDAGDGIKR
ncbi:glycoside hydrolase family 3 protein [Natronoflexus pectinivorans]|uniref:beta-N-acetylhexosaminidase n=1 Tax=Natronoflexus pectinivorans TaxID=682526 RepID=A0A4R2GM15_9BACT|nr:glycoside hydrolase family 3 protein [Natronoflexus pectinivorans]TCO09800.1 beta-glucosidase-like glycosyl hydrolase [Natronoflexus pectinivorans]